MNMKANAPAQEKHIPLRMCAICRESKPKSELSRYVRTGKGQPHIPDPDKNKPGRGIYLCHREECKQRFEKVSLRK